MESMNQDKTIAETLSEFVVQQKFEAIPKETVENGKMFILDVIGCIVGASNEQQALTLLEIMKEEGGNPHSSVFAQGFKTSAMNAAMVE